MNLFTLSLKEQFVYGLSDLNEFLNVPIKTSAWAILFCRKGNAVISMNLQNYKIRKNAEVTILPGTIFTVLSADNNFQVSYITFSRQLGDEAMHGLGPEMFKFLRSNPCYMGNANSIAHISLLMKGGELLYKDLSNRYRDIIIRNYLQGFLYNIADKVQYLLDSRLRNGNTNRKEEIFHKFINYVIEESPRIRNVEYYADKLCISSRYLSSICLVITGNESAKDVIDRHTVLEIKVLLQTTNLTLQEIADRLNFSDQSNFGRFFKAKVGESPKDYRSRLCR